MPLKPGQKKTLQYTRQLREDLQQHFPADKFFFLSANITNQILDFGLPAPIDVQVIGRNEKSNYQLALNLAHQMRTIRGAVDVHVRQQVSYPKLQIDVNRSKAEQLGLTQRDVANSMLISLSGSGQTAPNEWLNPENDVNYQIVVQTPLYKNNTFASLGRTPITSPAGQSRQLLDNLVRFHRGIAPIVIDHYAVQPVFDIFANVDRRDLGGVANDIQKLIADQRKHLVPGSQITLRGQVTDDEGLVFPSGSGNSIRHDVDLPSDGCELPVVGGSFRNPDGPSRRILRNSLDGLPDGYHPKCAFADGNYHDDRRRNGKQYSTRRIR